MLSCLTKEQKAKLVEAVNGIDNVVNIKVQYVIDGNTIKKKEVMNV